MKKLLLTGMVMLLLAACGNESDGNATVDNTEETDTSSEAAEENQEAERAVEDESNVQVNESATEEQDEQTDSDEVAQGEEAESSSSEDMKTTYRNKLVDLEEQLAKEEQEIGSTQAELTDFAGKSFNMWDDALNEVYAALEKQLPEDEMESLREEQRAWVESRDVQAAEEAAKYEGGSMESMQYISTQAQLTKERAYELITNYMS